MPVQETDPGPIQIMGDIAASSEVNTSRKGGSMTVTLKKPVRAGFGETQSHLRAATLQFDAGPELVLIGGRAERDNAVHVRKTGDNTFEITLETGAEAPVDDMTAAFLRLRIEQFRRNELALSAPIDADAWDADLAEKTSRFQAAISIPD